MKAQIIILITVLSVGSLLAQSKKTNFDVRQFYEIDKGHSYVEFSVAYMGYAKVKGRFADFEGVVRFDEADILKTSVSLSIQVESIDTDLDWRDKDLKSDAWLDAEKFPKINFQSKSIVKTDDGFDVTGNLTIRDVTKEITLNMNESSGLLTDTRGDSQVIFTGSIEIDRTVYGVQGERWSKIKEGITAVDSKVNIEISILGKRMNKRNLSGWFRNEERSHSKIYKSMEESGVTEALEKFRSLKEAGEKVNVNTLRLVGTMLLKSDNPKDAINIFKENIKAFPDNSDAYTDLGDAYAESGKLKDASISYKKALELDSTNIRAIEILRHLD